MAAACLLAGLLGTASAVHESLYGPTVLALISPQEAQAWIDVIVSALNKLFAVINVALGVWQSIELARQHRRRKRRTHDGSTPPPTPGPR